MRRKLIWIAPLAILGIIAFIVLGGEVVMYLWNWLLPALFGWRLITFWQALGLLALCRILFGGHGGPKLRRRMGERKWPTTPEEREKWRQAMRARCGFGPPPTPASGTGQPA